MSGGTLSATAGGVSSFNTRTGAVTLTESDVTSFGYTAGTVYQRIPLNNSGQQEVGEISWSSGTVELLNIRVLQSGTFRFYFTSTFYGIPASARIYKNGTAFGTLRSTAGTGVAYTEDLAVSAGDTIQLFGINSPGGSAGNLRIGTSAAAKTDLFKVAVVGDR